MNVDVHFQVSDVLKTKLFTHAKVIAGEKGLLRQVKWVHVLEVPAVEDLLNGGELILTTAAAFHDQLDVFKVFLKQLIDSGAAGLCIEFVPLRFDVPKELIAYAEEKDFPLILFTKEVKFVNITQHLHTMLIERQYQMMADLEALSSKLNELLLTPHPQMDILDQVYKHIKGILLLIPVQGEAIILSDASKRTEEVVMNYVQHASVPKGYEVYQKPVLALKQTFADLVLIHQSNTLSEFEMLVMDKGANALAQQTLRELYTEELKKTKENDWLQKWFNEEHTERDIIEHLEETEGLKKPSGCVVMLFQKNHQIEEIAGNLYFLVSCRSIFQRAGFHLVSYEHRGQAMFILLNTRKPADWKERAEKAANEIKQSYTREQHHGTVMNFGIGRYCNQFQHMSKSYQTAKEVLHLKKVMPHRVKSPFYQDLHMLCLMPIMKESGVLECMVKEYLEPVILYDKQNSSRLYQTLNIFLQTNGSKKETASQLYIVRQTLYHRLDKLYALLGEDMMQAPKRQAIEFAILSYEFLQGNRHE
ncbi:PucR family transcriptional regulator ligand-binding domain-containing protein [Bacillus pumilus]|nr:PucR family transcriptional regulator ligand-binding domain-containing protein [Bacillus pumilus]